MTYGWAILVVLIVIGALAYFGVFNPSNLLPERCALTQGLSCSDWRVDSSTGNVSLSLQNAQGVGILVKNIQMVTLAPPRVSCNFTAGGTYGAETGVVYVPNGASVSFQVGGSGAQSGLAPALANNCSSQQVLTQMKQSNRKYKWEVNITWFREYSSSLFAHTMTGELLARIE